MTDHLQIQDAASAGFMGSRPLRVNTQTGIVQIANGRGLQVNSLLKRDEWKEFDDAVVEAARQKLSAIARLRGLGLTKRLGGLGTLVSYYHQASEMTAASVSITGQATGESDRVEFNLAGVPIPVIFKPFSIGSRQLAAARQNGDQIDTSNVSAAARVVAESYENMLFNGSGVVLAGQSIYGFTTHPSRATDTATNYGGGDWTTATNIEKTVIGMMSAAAGRGFRGPFGLFVARHQYFEMLNEISATDLKPLQRVEQLPGMSFVEWSDWLVTGSVVLVQLTNDVVDLAEAQDIMVVEWMSGDGSVANFKVMMVGAPRVKSEFASKAGIVHATGA